MDETFLIIHREHVENYFESLFNTFDSIDLIEKKKDFLEYKLSIEKGRLNRYKALGLNSELYIDHKILTNDIKDIIFKLEYIIDTLFKEISPIQLNYGEHNSSVIKIMYDHLYPEKIKIQFDDFRSHFDINFGVERITWQGTEPELIILFSSIKILNKNISQMLSEHFINSQGNEYKPKQLSVTKSKATHNYIGKDKIDLIISTIKSVL